MNYFKLFFASLLLVLCSNAPAKTLDLSKGLSKIADDPAYEKIYYNNLTLGGGLTEYGFGILDNFNDFEIYPEIPVDQQTAIFTGLTTPCINNGCELENAHLIIASEQSDIKVGIISASGGSWIVFEEKTELPLKNSIESFATEMYHHNTFIFNNETGDYMFLNTDVSSEEDDSQPAK
jgi:hypothetical protein